MRIGFVKIFVASTEELFQEVTGPEVKVDSVSMREGPVTGREVKAVVCLSGEAQGRVIFDMDVLTAVHLAGQMLGEPSPGMTPMVRSAIAELASMAIGRAISRINDAGTKITMSPPAVISGESNLFYDVSFETLVAPISTGHGEVRINITIQDLH
jgi:CheY-specific phosphatase CheX